MNKMLNSGFGDALQNTVCIDYEPRDSGFNSCQPHHKKNKRKKPAIAKLQAFFLGNSWKIDRHD